ncbi:MAG: N-acetyl-alpha-D-glucosaminyl L-malate synthase BshA [Candidatus Latescibacterota bacterium]|nr:MAG: N-acetyl-alpha-D-glucosaminyl L-malate synthase BshA [Candidatus Latescibacterota bacterium]
MRIGITCYPSAGGSGVIATELGHALAERGHEVHFVSYSRPFRLEVKGPGIHFHKVKTVQYPLFKYPPYSLALAVRIAEVVRKENLDLFHVHYAIPHATSAFLANQILGERRVKVVTTLHGTDITLVGAEESFLEITKFSIEQCDAVTAVSAFLARETRVKLRVEKPIDVIPNFVDPAIFDGGTDATLRQRLDLGDRPTLIHISNFRKVKNVRDVVRLFARVRKDVDAELLLIGDGPERVPCLILAEELGVEKRIHFLGNRVAVHRILPLADILLLPSTVESFGLVALEAMACGVPVIGYDGGGLPEVVRSGTDGLLAPLGDLERMIEMTRELLQNPMRRKKMGEAARVRAATEFSTDKVTTEYENMYRRVLGGGA